MEQKKEKIIEKYRELNKECKKYPRIQLGRNGEYPIFNKKEFTTQYAEGGFVEVFCLSPIEQNMVKETRAKMKQKVK